MAIGILKKPTHTNIIFLISFVLFGLIVPICYLSHPLFDDESVFLEIGDFIRNGSLLYRDVADIKPPGIFYLAALIFSAAGKSFIAARVLTFVVNIASALLILKLGTKIKDKNVGMTTSILFLIGIYLSRFQGYYYKTEPYAVFFILLSVLFFLKESRRYKFTAGLMLGMGVLFKQTTILVFGVFFLFYLLRIRFQRNRTKDYIINSAKNLVVIFSGLAVPLFITFIYFLIMGAVNEMLYYTIFFASEYGAPFSLFKMTYGFFSYLPVALMSISMVLLAGYRFLRGKIVDDRHLLLVLWMLLLSIPALTISVDHRVLFVIPPASLLAGLLLCSLYKNLKRRQISDQVKVFIITTLLVTTAISLGTNAYFLPTGSVDDQIRCVREIEQYVDGKVYAFPSDTTFFFFSNLTPGLTFLGGVFSEEIAKGVIEDLQVNNVSYVIVRSSRLVNIIEMGELQYLDKPHRVIYDYVEENYDVFITTEEYIIYKSRLVSS